MTSIFLSTILGLTTVPYEYIEEKLTQDEGNKLNTYICTAGRCTIGRGFNLDANDSTPIIGRKLKAGSTITEEESKKLFQYMIIKTLQDLHKIFPAFNNLPNNVQYILINLHYQLGPGGLRKFKNFIKATKEGNTSGMVTELLDSAYAKQVRSRCMRLIGILKKSTL